MFIERLTEHDIEKFRIITPLTVEGKIIPFKIHCNNTFYSDVRGSSTDVIFLKDFTLSIPFITTDETKNALKRHYRQFMIDTFGDEYRNALSLHLFKNSDTEKTVEEEQTL